MKNAVYLMLALIALFLVWSVVRFIAAKVFAVAFLLLFIAVFVGVVYVLYKTLTRAKQRL